MIELLVEMVVIGKFILIYLPFHAPKNGCSRYGQLACAGVLPDPPASIDALGILQGTSWNVCFFEKPTVGTVGTSNVNGSGKGFVMLSHDLDKVNVGYSRWKNLELQQRLVLHKSKIFTIVTMVCQRLSSQKF